MSASKLTSRRRRRTRNSAGVGAVERLAESENAHTILDIHYTEAAVQHGRTPVYENWLPYATSYTRAVLQEVTVLESHCAGLGAGGAKHLAVCIRYVHQLLVVLTCLVNDADVRSRILEPGATWEFDGVQCNCIMLPLARGLWCVLERAVELSVDTNAVQMTLGTRSNLLTQMSTVLAITTRSMEYLDDIEDGAIRELVEPFVKRCNELRQWLRAFLLWVAGTNVDPLQHGDLREGVAMLDGTSLTRPQNVALEDARQNFMGCRNLLEQLPAVLTLGKHVAVDVYERMDEGDYNFIWAARAREVAKNGEPTWPEQLLEQLLYVTALQAWAGTRIPEAVALARLAAGNSCPIRFADAWDAYQEHETEVLPDVYGAVALLSSSDQRVERQRFVRGPSSVREDIEKQAEKMKFMMLGGGGE